MSVKPYISFCDNCSHLRNGKHTFLLENVRSFTLSYLFCLASQQVCGTMCLLTLMLLLKCVANGVMLSHYGHITNDIYLNYNTLINEIDIKIKVT